MILYLYLLSLYLIYLYLSKSIYILYIHIIVFSPYSGQVVIDYMDEAQDIMIHAHRYMIPVSYSNHFHLFICTNCEPFGLFLEPGEIRLYSFHRSPLNHGQCGRAHQLGKDV